MRPHKSSAAAAHALVLNIFSPPGVSGRCKPFAPIACLGIGASPIGVLGKSNRDHAFPHGSVAGGAVLSIQATVPRPGRLGMPPGRAELTLYVTLGIASPATKYL